MKETSNKSLRDKIKEMIVAELAEDTAAAEDVKLTDPLFEEEVEEAKKKDEEVEDVEDVEVTDTEEEMPADEEMPAEEAPVDVAGGLEDISADMKGTDADLMDHLMKAFQIAKGMGNEKLETQVGNTLKFFVSEYIGGGEG
jgi:head-tail adaptor